MSSTAQLTPATPHEAEARIAALELFVQHLVFLLDVAGAVHTDALNRWIDNARERMLITGSVPAEQVAALGALQALVAR